jgi:hypothetical protein
MFILSGQSVEGESHFIFYYENVVQNESKILENLNFTSLSSKKCLDTTPRTYCLIDIYHKRNLK